MIEFHWKDGKMPKKAPIEKFVQRVDKKPIGNDPFVFNGSRMFEGSFLAQRDGSIVSLITDNAAQFNNARQGRGDDDSGGRNLRDCRLWIATVRWSFVCCKMLKKVKTLAKTNFLMLAIQKFA